MDKVIFPSISYLRILMVDRIRFVALGDSLTTGFQSPRTFLPGREEFPHAWFLETILSREMFEKGLDHVDVSFRNMGILGDTTQNMLERFDSHVAAQEPDYVIVWGGINDLFMFQPLESILSNLKQIYGKAREVGSEPIACTITSVLGYDQMIPRIIELNDMIKGYCAEYGILFADLFAATSDEQGKLKETFSRDGVHLSHAGYRKVAYTLYYEVIESILERIREVEKS